MDEKNVASSRSVECGRFESDLWAKGGGYVARTSRLIIWWSVVVIAILEFKKLVCDGVKALLGVWGGGGRDETRHLFHRWEG